MSLPEINSHPNQSFTSVATLFAPPLNFFSLSFPSLFKAYALEASLYAADRISFQAIFISRSSCFSFVVFRVALIVVSCLKDGAVDEVLKAVGFEASCCAIIAVVVVVVVVALEDNEQRIDDAPDDDRGEIDDIEEKEGEGVSMDIDENIFDRICSPPLFDFVAPLTYLCIILYFDPLLSW